MIEHFTANDILCKVILKTIEVRLCYIFMSIRNKNSFVDIVFYMFIFKIYLLFG